MSHLYTSFGDFLRCDNCDATQYSEGSMRATDVAWDRGWQIAWQSLSDDRDLCPDCLKRRRP